MILLTFNLEPGGLANSRPTNIEWQSQPIPDSKIISYLFFLDYAEKSQTIPDSKRLSQTS